MITPTEAVYDRSNLLIELAPQRVAVAEAFTEAARAIDRKRNYLAGSQAETSEAVYALRSAYAGGCILRHQALQRVADLTEAYIMDIDFNQAQADGVNQSSYVFRAIPGNGYQCRNVDNGNAKAAH